MDMILERGRNKTMSGQGRGGHRNISEVLEQSIQLLKTMLHPYSRNRFYIPCTFKLRTYDAMLKPSGHNIRENDSGVMRDKLTSMGSIWPMAEHKEMIHIIEFNISVAPRYPSSPLPTRRQNLN